MLITSNYDEYRKSLFNAIGRELPIIETAKTFEVPTSATSVDESHYRQYLLRELQSNGIRITKESIGEINAFLLTKEGKEGCEKFLNSRLVKKLQPSGKNNIGMMLDNLLRKLRNLNSV